ncbi:S8 family peptidase [Noviherbaspirillum galbum]|uniref:S8 family serine peptidase n=1 Tax=Noviherbaspirillum galbum TaxID=2709383 RepID=A0A6B3SRJ7_9BURK|nr:S8 family serine peptidase [Noviherbaspirillum galbum]NEX63271.1 S8 family serine peptidase [Noviherbaspirillum galbum]
MLPPAISRRTMLVLAFAGAHVLPGAQAQTTVTQVLAGGVTDIDYLNSAAVLGKINAGYAYAHKLSGAGVTVGVLDAGITPAHREFSDPGKILPGFNALDGGSDVTDHVGHGTHVAGIVAAQHNGMGTMGVAFGASILPVKVLGDDGRGSSQALDRGLRFAIGKAPIVNVSLGAENAYSPAAMKEAAQAGMLIVAAAGNSGAANPGWPARFARESWAGNQIIAVGAVDASNRIASFSNRAGDTAGWFLVAPGVNVLSTWMNGQYATMSGTSMAAPVVSGAAALLKQQWPALSAAQIANILFVTATDLGVPGIDPIYGRGLLNIEKALQPIGTLTTTTLNGRTISVLSGTTQVSSATTRLLGLATTGQLRVVGLDGFQRDYQVDLGRSVLPPAGLSLEQVFGGMDRRIDVAEHVLPGGGELAVAYARAPARAGSLFGHEEGRGGIAALSYVAQRPDRSFAFGMGSTAGNYFGAGGLLPQQGLALGSVTALAHPYFALVPGAAHAGFARRADDFGIKFGVLSTGADRTLDAPDIWMPPGTGRQLRARSSLVELSRDDGHAALALSFARIQEASGYLGSYASGPLVLANSAYTQALQLSGAVRIASGIALAGQASYAATPGVASDAGLITGVGTTRTNAFSLALIAAGRFRPHDRLSLSVSQPMRTYAGMMTMDAYTGLDDQGSPTREKMRFSMVPSGRELRGELNYLVPLRAAASVGMTLMLRHEPNHLADAAAEKLLALRYLAPF